jgi:hypothetical protein
MDKKDLAQDKKTAAKAVHMHEKNMHPGKAPTKMKAGGKTNADMLKYGRNMAKVMNQRSTGRKGG